MPVDAPVQFIGPREPKPEWLKVRAPGSQNFVRLKGIMQELKLNTVCEDAHCPNIGECWHHGTATFMILGDVCTRACAYCAVAHGRPNELDTAEPARVAEAVARMGLKFAVITSVDRDDLQGRRRLDLRRDHPADARARAGLPHRGADPGLPGRRVVAAHGARRRPRRAEPQRRDRAAALSHGALGRTLRAHAGTARSLAQLPARHRHQDRPHGGPRRGARRDPVGVRRPAARGRLDPDHRPVPAAVGDRTRR